LLKISRQADGTPEIFYSVQGEGISSGKPAVFLRLSLCNLACSWCDTKYTWLFPSEDASRYIIKMSADEIAQIIMSYGCHLLVVTGGEPMLQQKELLSLLKNLKQKGFNFEIETNGTILPESEIVKLIDHWNISPKLNNSGNQSSLREKPECYRFFNDLASSHFKFVIDNESDFQEVKTMAHKYGIRAEKIILMPQAIDRQILLQKSRWLVELCKSEGYLFSVRLQILLWGNKRGI